MNKVADIIFFKIFKWKVLGNSNLPKKCVVIVAPHTHWIDFFLAMIVRKVTNQNINFIAKQELFKFPLGYFIRMLGGRPVNRTSRSKTVDVISEIFNNETEFKLGISPEGTRKKVKKWKTGFYYIAKKASVPIISVTLNFNDKNVNFSPPYYPTDNFETDLKKIRSFFRDVKGKIPKYS